MKVSILYGKKISNGAGVKGYVLGVNCADGRLTALTCADYNENNFNVDFGAVKSIKNAITFTGDICEAAAGEPVRLGKPVFDCCGNYLGKLTDITVENGKITQLHVDKIKFDFKDTVTGDAVLIKNTARILKSDVKKGSRTIIKRGTPLTPEVLKKAEQRGEYVQANLKCL